MSPRPSDADIQIFKQIVAEFARTDPELRALMNQTGTGAAGVSAPVSEWPAILAALRALPDDAGRPAITRALARWHPRDQQDV